MNERRLPLWQHLSELRTCLIRSLLACLAGFLVSWQFREPIFAALLRPASEVLAERGNTLQAIAPTEIFFTYLKGSALAGLLLALPVIFWQVWGFIAPGLYPNERRHALLFALVSTLLFFAGAGFGYSVVFSVVYHFLNQFDSEFVTSVWSMREVFGLSARLLLAFGLAFELPTAIFFFVMAGIVDARQLLRAFPYAALACCVVGAVLTPPDWVSQVLIALPMMVLYLLGAGFAHLVTYRRRPKNREVIPREPEA